MPTMAATPPTRPTRPGPAVGMAAKLEDLEDSVALASEAEAPVVVGSDPAEPVGEGLDAVFGVSPLILSARMLVAWGRSDALVL